MRRIVLEREPELVRRLLAEREPVSNQLGTREPGWHFLIDVALWRDAADWLWYCEELDALVVAKLEGGTLRVRDLVARRLPTLSQVSAAFGGAERGVERIECYLTPDRVGDLELEPSATPLEDVLMVRGSWPVEGSAVALSPLSRC